MLILFASQKGTDFNRNKRRKRKIIKSIINWCLNYYWWGKYLGQEVGFAEDFSWLRSATARRRRTVPSSAASVPNSSASSKTSADGMWRGECLSPSGGKPLQGRWRAHNPTARVGRLQSYRQTSAVESCGGAPSAGHHCEIWQWWLLSVSTKCTLKYLDIRMSHSEAGSTFLLLAYDTQLSKLCGSRHGDLVWSLFLSPSKVDHPNLSQFLIHACLLFFFF